MSRILLYTASAVMAIAMGTGYTKTVAAFFAPVTSAFGIVHVKNDCRSTGNCFYR